MCPLSVSKSDLQRHAALLSVADTIGIHHSPADLLRKVSPQLRSVLSFDVIYLALWDSSTNRMRIFSWEDSEQVPPPLEVSVEASIVGSVWRHQATVYLDDLTAHEECRRESQWLRRRDISSYCAVPLSFFRAKMGALAIGGKRPVAFQPQYGDFLARVAEMLAPSLDRGLSESALTEEAAGMRLLLEVGGAALLSDRQQIIPSILASLQKWTPRDYVGIYLYEEASRSLRLHMSDLDLAERMAPHGLAPLGGSLAGQTFRSAHSLTLDYSSLAGMPLDSVKRGMSLGVKALCLCPIATSKRRIGVLKIARREGDSFSRRMIETLERAASEVGSSLELARREIHPERLTAQDVSQKSTESAGYSAITDPLRSSASWLHGVRRTAAGIPPKEGGNGFLSGPETLMDFEQFLSAYFKAARVGLCILDTDFRYLAINETLAEMNGLPAGAHLGKTVREILGDFAELVEPQIRRVVATGNPVSDLEISFVPSHRTQPGHWLEQFFPIKGPAGNITQIGAAVVEITDQKKLQESLHGAYESLRKERARQQVLMEVSRLLAARWDIREAFPKVSASLRRVLHQEYATLSLREEESEHLVPQALDFPLGKSLRAGGEIGRAKSAGGKALRERAPLIFSQEAMHQFDSSLAANLNSEGLKSLCCVPLLRPKGPLGVLILGSTRKGAFQTDDLELLNQVAAQLAIAIENAAIRCEVHELKHRLDLETHNAQGDPRNSPQFAEIIGDSQPLRQAMDQLAVIAPTDAAVLLLGETGTGKNLFAHAIHRASKRKDRNFVSLNCAAIPTGLVESELFGHEKGAFTGAVSQKIGRLELADKGTLFLDEIGEIPLEFQPKLLRVLQDFEFERLGATRTIKVDVRLIAATNRDLAKSVTQKEFRSDLFYRLNVFPLRIPSLRERSEDIPHLVRYFVRKFSAAVGRNIQTIPSGTMNALIHGLWPGNVRELENFIERSVILTDGTALRAPLAELQAELSRSSEQSLQDIEREHIIHILRETAGILSGPLGAARRLGLKRTTLQSRMQRLGIRTRDYLGPKQK